MYDYLEYYYANNGEKLKKMVDGILVNFGGISDKDNDWSLFDDNSTMPPLNTSSVHPAEIYTSRVPYGMVRIQLLL